MVVPDWTRLANRYAGVHLSVAGYLAAAGTVIDVDSETASVTAGWAPDETYWLTDDFQRSTDITTWTLHRSWERCTWVGETGS